MVDSAPPTLRLATDQDRAQLEELFTSYLQELAPYSDLVDPNESLSPLWLTKPDELFPYCVVQGEDTVGFALVMNARYAAAAEIDAEWALAEMYVIPELRGTGIAVRAFHEILAARPGRWGLAVLPENEPAMRFWDRVLAPFEVRMGVGDQGLPTRLFEAS